MSHLTSFHSSNTGVVCFTQTTSPKHNVYLICSLLCVSMFFHLDLLCTPIHILNNFFFYFILRKILFYEVKGVNLTRVKCKIYTLYYNSSVFVWKPEYCITSRHPQGVMSQCRHRVSFVYKCLIFIEYILWLAYRSYRFSFYFCC